jgi:hypothetical protein
VAPPDRPWNGPDDQSAERTTDEPAGRSPPWRRVVLVVGVLAVGVAFVAVFVLGLTEPACACSPPSPSINWAYDADDRTVRGSHAGGDEFTHGDTDRLVVSVDGDRARQVELPFEVGDEFVVGGVDPGQRVRLVWSPNGSDVTTTVAEFEVPGE